MKLISTFYDYYDSAKCFSFCEGSEAVYVRKPEEHKIQLPSLNSTYYLSSDWKYRRGYTLSKNTIPAIEFSIIGFCGKFYPIYKIVIPSPTENFLPDKEIYFYGEDINLLTEFFKERDFKKVFHKLIKKLKKNNKKIKEIDKEIVSFKRKMENYLQKITPILEPLFIKYQTPCFLVTKEAYKQIYLLETNPVLKDIKFFKVFPSVIAYQEIEMFFNSVLVKNEEHIQITDSAVLLVKKGFDKKKSFRHRK